jgi:hypothetical protein
MNDKLINMYPKPDACLGCPLAVDSLGCTEPSGNVVNPKYLFILSGARRNEVHYNEALHLNSWPGNVLRSWIEEVNIPIDDCYFDNVLACQKIGYDKKGRIKLNAKTKLPVTLEPTYKEAMECTKRNLLPRLEKLLPTLKKVTLIPVGPVAMRTLLGNRTNLKAMGSLTNFDFPHWRDVVKKRNSK